MGLRLNSTLEIVDVSPQFVVDSFLKSIEIQFNWNGKRYYLVAQEIYTTKLPRKAGICASPAPT